MCKPAENEMEWRWRCRPVESVSHESRLANCYLHSLRCIFSRRVSLVAYGQVRSRFYHDRHVPPTYIVQNHHCLLLLQTHTAPAVGQRALLSCLSCWFFFKAQSSKWRPPLGPAGRFIGKYSPGLLCALLLSQRKLVLAQTTALQLVRRILFCRLFAVDFIAGFVEMHCPIGVLEKIYLRWMCFAFIAALLRNRELRLGLIKRVVVLFQGMWDAGIIVILSGRRDGATLLERKLANDACAIVFRYLHPKVVFLVLWRLIIQLLQLPDIGKTPILE